MTSAWGRCLTSPTGSLQLTELDSLVEHRHYALLNIMQGAFTQRLGFNSYILLWYIVVLQPKEESLEPFLVELPQSDVRSALVGKKLAH